MAGDGRFDVLERKRGNFDESLFAFSYSTYMHFLISYLIRGEINVSFWILVTYSCSDWPRQARVTIGRR